jgi:beta-lactamase class A
LDIIHQNHFNQIQGAYMKITMFRNRFRNFSLLRLIISAVIGLSFMTGIPVTSGVAAAGGHAPGIQNNTKDDSQTEKIIAQFAQIAGGTVGVSAVHIETGRRLTLNNSERFPMASSYKFPIALAILNKLDHGSLSLSQDVRLGVSDLRPWGSPIAELAQGRPISLTLGRLLELMLITSDNTASDALLKLAGGPAAVTARVRELGVKGMDINRSEGELAVAVGDIKLPPEAEWSPVMWEKLLDDDKASKSSVDKFLADSRDTTTPDAMVELLVQAFQGKALSPGSTKILLDLMTAATTGTNRLKALLPPGTKLAHKTGTFPTVGTINDVGVITLPNGGGHIAIAVMMKSADEKYADQERAIAEIARTVYDHFLLTR